MATVFSLNSCEIFRKHSWDSQQIHDEVFYGVGDHIDELNNTCVLIPTIGHVSMPQLDDGTTPSFKKGDLIEITFKGVFDDFAIMESYPARFGGRADEIKVVSANVELKYNDEGGFFIEVDTPDTLSGVSIGDTVVAKTKVEENGGFIEKDFAQCTVEEIDGERMTMSFDVGASEILREMLYERLWFVK